MARTVDVKLSRAGTWCCRLYLGRDASGRKRQAYRSFPGARDRADAQMQAAEWAAGMTAGGRVASARLADLLADYIGMRQDMGASPNSVKQYRLFAKYAREHFGNARADKLTALDFTRFLGALVREGGKDGQGLSANTVNACYQFLRGFYKYFAAVGVLPGNPMLAAAKPAAELPEAIALCEADVSALTAYVEPLALMRGDAEPRERAYAFCCWLALRTGMREGEVCALRPCDVAAGGGFLHVGGNVVEESGRARTWRRARRSRPGAGSAWARSRAAPWPRPTGGGRAPRPWRDGSRTWPRGWGWTPRPASTRCGTRTLAGVWPTAWTR